VGIDVAIEMLPMITVAVPEMDFAAEFWPVATFDSWSGATGWKVPTARA
jgi:hypothetical protein